MRLHVLLTVIVALIASMAGTAAAGERGRHQSITPHAGVKLHAGHPRSAIVPGLRNDRAKSLHRIRPAAPRSAHGRSWRSDGERRLGFERFRRDHFAGKHRRHRDHRPAFGVHHERPHSVIARDRFGYAIEIIIGSRHGHVSKRRHRFRD